MNCWVYKSVRKEDVYLYVVEPQALERLPEDLARALGRLELVMELSLHPQRKLARADAAAVMKALEEQGFYLQMPPPAGSA